MARALAFGVASSATNPVLDLWTLVGGALADVTALVFSIYDLSTGTPTLVAGPTAVVVSGPNHLSTGRYVAPYTAAGNTGRHRIVWLVTFPDASQATYQADFDVLAAGLSLKGPAYCLLSDLRDEGFTTAMVSDLRALTLIRTVSTFIERWTRRFFEPRYRTVELDGSRGPSQWIPDPVIALASAAVDGSVVDPTCYKVFNRHVSEGLTNPDDRDNPRITFQRIVRSLQVVDSSDRPYINKQIFWPGPRSVQLVGLFGFTDPDPDVQVGATPELIKRAAMLLFSREMLPMADGDGRSDAQNAFRVNSLRTRDQSVGYGPDRSSLIGRGGGEFTGDPAIDDIIAQYVAPMFIGSP